MSLLLLFIYAQLDEQMERHIDNKTMNILKFSFISYYKKINSRHMHLKAKPLRRTDRRKDIRSDGVSFMPMKL